MKAQAKIHINLLPYQLKLLKSSKSYLALIGGTGCGKTFFLPRWLYVRICQFPNEEWIVSAPTREMLKRNPIKYIKKFFKENNIKYDYNKADLIMTLPGLATIYFISAETPDRMQGIHAKGIMGDEAGLFDRLWWDTALQRIAYRQGQILLTTTPYCLNWLKTEVWDKWISGDKAFCIENPSSLSNPFYPKEEYERAKRDLPDWKFKMFFEGKFTKPAGLIYENYETVEPFPIPKDWYRFGGVDFGFNNPFAVIWLAEDPKTENIYAYKEFKKSKLTVDDMEKVVKREKCSVYYGDYASKESLETIRSKGINMRIAKKDVSAGISFVQSLFKTHKLKIFKNLIYTLDELNSYQWKVDRTGESLDKPVKKNDHLCVLPGTMIITATGVKPIEEVKEGELVLTHRGRFRKVIKLHERPYDGDIYLLKARGKEPLWLTSGHPVLLGIAKRCFRKEGNRKLTGQLRVIDNFVFTEVDKIKLPVKKTDPRSLVCFPKVMHSSFLTRVDMKKFLPNWVEKEGFLYATLRNGKGINPKSPACKRWIEISDELAFAIGYFVANGSKGGDVNQKGNRKTVSFAGHIDHKTVIPIVEKALKPFGVTKFFINKRANAIIIGVNSKPLFEFLKECRKNPGKRFPDFVFQLPYKQTLFIVAGYLMGDGCFTDGYLRANTVSRELAYQLYTMLVKLGFRPRIRLVKKAGRWKGINGLIKRDQYNVELSITDTQLLLNRFFAYESLRYAFQGKKTLCKKAIQSSYSNFLTDNYLCSTIEKIEKEHYKGLVYNLTVEEDNSYVANGITLHNCDALRYSVFTYYSDRPSTPMVRPSGATRMTSRMFRRY